MKRLAVVASRGLWPTPDIYSQLLSIILTLPPKNGRKRAPVLATRLAASLNVINAPVERLAVEIALKTERVTDHFLAVEPGRAGVYKRDYAMVEWADKVLAFFHPEKIMEGGTGHVVHAALQKNVPVEAWTLDEHGILTLIGSDGGSYELSDEGREWAESQFKEEPEVSPLVTPITWKIGPVTTNGTATIPLGIATSITFETKIDANSTGIAFEKLLSDFYTKKQPYSIGLPPLKDE